MLWRFFLKFLKLWGRGEGDLWSVFHAELNSRKFGLLNIHVRLVNITYKYIKEIFD